MIEEIVEQMLTEAKNLRGDTLVSMAEGFCNERMADEIERWANRLKGTYEEDAWNSK